MADFEPYDYVPALQRLTMLARLIADEPIDELLAYTTRVDSLGPILDPTSYRAGMKNIEEHRRLLNALKKVQGVVEELRAEAEARTP